ncbi:MAG: hypothetical protein PVG90_13645 [Bacillota bacterium]|jgi:hypothetical protein
MKVKFYATQNDLLKGLEKIKSLSSLQYIRSGVYPSPEFEVRTSLESQLLKNSNSFLVKKTNQQIRPRPKRTEDGRQIFIIDQINNSNTIIFTPSECDDHQYFKCGCISTLFKNEISVELFRFFSRTLKTGYTLRNYYWIGPEALNLIINGKVKLIK